MKIGRRLLSLLVMCLDKNHAKDQPQNNTARAQPSRHVLPLEANKQGYAKEKKVVTPKSLSTPRRKWPYVTPELEDKGSTDREQWRSICFIDRFPRQYPEDGPQLLLQNGNELCF